MPQLTNVAAYGHAIDIVKTAISAGTIRFTQADMNGHRDAAGDAKYLNDLINALAKNLQTSSD